MSPEDIGYDTNNVFFPKNVPKEWIYTTIRKNVDIFNMVRQDGNDKIIDGIGLISLSSEEIQSIIDCIKTSKDYIIVGEDFVQLLNTDIEVDALIINTI